MQRRRKAGEKSRSPFAGEQDERELCARHPPALDHVLLVAVPQPDRHPGLAVPDELRDHELAALQHLQQVAGQVQVALVDLVDEQRAWLFRRDQRRSQWAELEEGADLVPAAPAPRPGRRSLGHGRAQALGVDAAERVVAVQGLGQRAARGDVPAQHTAEPQLMGHLLDHGGLPGPRRAAHEQRAAEVQGRVHRVDEAGRWPVLAVLRPARESPPRRRVRQCGLPLLAVATVVGLPGHHSSSGPATTRCSKGRQNSSHGSSCQIARTSPRQATHPSCCSLHRLR